jgi:hypothetical protein
MRGLIFAVGRRFGFRFAPDNHLVPVLHFERYHRLEGPGVFWTLPLIERTLEAISTGLRVGNFTFDEILSRDNIPFTFQLTVLFTFEPAQPPKNIAAQLVRLPGRVLLDIVQDYTSQALRRLASRVEAEALGAESTLAHIERDLTRFLTAQLRILGIAPLKNGGVLIKETVAPEKFERAMLTVRRHEAILSLLARYRELNLIDQAIRAGFLSGLEDHAGNLTLLSPLEMAQLPPWLGSQAGSHRNGRWRRHERDDSWGEANS